MTSSGTFNYYAGGVSYQNMVGVTAIIHTDPVIVNGTPRVEVDRFDRTGFGEVGQEVNPTNYMGRGGILQSSSTNNAINLNAGPNVFNRNRFYQGLHELSGTRGWIRIDYTGTPVNASQPYAMKTKVIAIGGWDIQSYPDLDVSLANFGYPMNRVTSFKTTLYADDRVEFDDIVRIGPSGSFGGIAVLTDKGTSPKAVLRNPANADHGYFRQTTSSSFSDASFNRGFIKIDYLAAECGEGSAYTRSFIGVVNPTANDCSGYYAPPGGPTVHVVQTKGMDIWNSADNFAFINKTNNSQNLFIKARVDKIENTNSWARAGIMMRATLNAGSRHVAMVVTPKPATGSGNGIGFTVRTYDNQSTIESSPNTFSAPYWVGIQKTGNTFKGYISTTGTGNPTSNPGSWSQVGSTATVSFPSSPTNYYIGLCQTAGNNSSETLNTSVYSGLSF